MNRNWRSRLGLVMVAAVGVTVGACAKSGQQAAKNDTAGTPTVKKAPTFATPANPYPHGVCTTVGDADKDCHGVLLKLDQYWARTVALGDLTQAVADMIGAISTKFDDLTVVGSAVAMGHHAKDASKDVPQMVMVQSIDDAYKVSNTEVTHPVLIGRLSHYKGDPNAEDVLYGVGKGASYFLIVDRAQDPTTAQSGWAIVRLLKRGNYRAKVVRQGTTYTPCIDSSGDYHPQKSSPFAWFVSCDVASQSFEKLIAGAFASRLDPMKRQQIESAFPPALQPAVRKMLDGDDPIWITCGLGCCST